MDPETIYNEAVNSAIEIHKKYSTEEKLNLDEVYGLINKLISVVSSGDDKIIFLATHTYLKDWLYYHSVNVSILTIKLGLNLKYSPDQLLYLGTLALLHGIVYPEGEGRGLPELEKQELIQQFIRDKQLKEGFIKEALSIIAILDVYESLTHKRQYRERLMPQEVLNAIISAGEEVFNPKIVKEIIEVFSIYPLGSLVRLNTEEVAQVIKINPGFPLRPQVAILIDSQGNKLKDEKTIDLSCSFNIFIKEPFEFFS